MSITVETDSMKILIDENIVHGRKLFEDYGEVTFKPGRNIKAEDLKNIDVLLVRSVTKVDENLLRYAKCSRASVRSLIGTISMWYIRSLFDLVSRKEILID